jgi:hypothetical protein
MLNRTLKSLIAVLILAGAPGAKSAATAPGTHRSSSVSSTLAPRVTERLPRRHRRQDDGCFELPAPAPTPAPAPAPAPVASCS